MVIFFAMYRKFREVSSHPPKSVNRPKPKTRAGKSLKSRIAPAINPLKKFLSIATGIFCAGFGLKGFLLPNNFIDGGVTGISLLIAETTGLPLSVLLLIVNTPFILLGFFRISGLFAVKTAAAICGLACCVAFVPYPLVTTDKLLIAVFGGLFLGAGIGLAIRGGAVIDGTEISAIYLNDKTGASVGDIILGLNIAIFALAAYLLGVEVALYAILTYGTASKAVDFLLEGIEEYTGVTVISSRSETIRTMILGKLRHGVTLYVGKRGMGKHGESGETEETIDILFTVVTRLEISRLQEEIERIDPSAFIIMSSVKDTKGGMIKKRPHQLLH